MQTVSFETAKALKEAGFPQPEPNESAQGYFYGEYANNTMGVVLYGHFECASYDIEVEAYAPTATDLLPHNWMLVRHGSQWECIEENEVDNFFANGFAPQNLFTDDNPHEAAAKAQIFVRKRNQSNV